jgi:hypothetical protein
MGLEFHRIGAGSRDRIDIGMRGAQTAVVCLSNLGDDQRRMARADLPTLDFKCRRVQDSKLGSRVGRLLRRVGLERVAVHRHDNDLLTARRRRFHLRRRIFGD